jgi:3-methylcrotonyl-CoA carboxylase alpha subunit
MENRLKMKPIQRILIANRGEIALRIIRAAAGMGITTIAVYAETDRDSGYVKAADISCSLGEGTLLDTYLNITKITELALQHQADAIHPGYGFLSENYRFPEACDAAGIIFIGPGANVIRLMGDKIESHNTVHALGIPVLEKISGSTDYIMGLKNVLEYPVLIKAAAGGGGKGMRIAVHAGELEDAISNAAREAGDFFADPRVYIEKYLPAPRHIEVQLLADHHGNVVHLFERECSLQRRHQKIIEEAPAASLSAAIRKKITGAAVNIASSIGYRNAGTIEFLLDNKGSYYFLEMNTRIQVEHPVTELITGVDLVKEQIRIAEGHVLSMKQQDITIKGHAIEARIYAEDPENELIPSPGTILHYREPKRKNIRIDSALESGSVIQPDFDPMISKVIGYGSDRYEAITGLIDALNDYAILGIRHNLPFIKILMNHPAYQKNHISTTFIQKHWGTLTGELKHQKEKNQQEVMLAALTIYLMNHRNLLKSKDSVWKQIGYWRIVPRILVSMNQQDYEISYQWDSPYQLKCLLQGQEFVIRLERLVENALFCEINLHPEVYFFGIAENGVLHLQKNGFYYTVVVPRRISEDLTPEQFEIRAHHNGIIMAPVHGRIISLKAKAGDRVNRGDVLVTMESMKMENKIVSPVEGLIDTIHVQENDQVQSDAILMTII